MKIPATPEGVPAIRDDDRRGPQHQRHAASSALERYDEVIEAYLARPRGPGRRQGGDLSGVHSVASFFVSRVDTEVDRRLEHRRPAPTRDGADALALRGKAAVAQARLAYELFRARFSGPRWEALGRAGAPRVQRPLWASTSTKNPAYPDLLYVDSLIGPDTVNTMPDATIDGVPRPRHRGPHRRRRPRRRPSRPSTRLAEVGVDLDDVAAGARGRGRGRVRQVLRRADADALGQGHRPDGAALSTPWPTTPTDSSPPPGTRRLAVARGQRLAEPPRLARRAAAAWMREARRPRRAGPRRIEQETVVLLGMGGSSLGPAVLAVGARRHRRPAAGAVDRLRHHATRRRWRSLAVRGRLRPRLVEVRDDARAERAASPTRGAACCRPDALRRDHRPGHAARRPAARASGVAPVLREPARHRGPLLGALVLRHGARRPRRLRRRRAVRARPRGRPSRRPPASAWPWAEDAARGPGQGDDRRRRDYALVRAVGRAAHRRVDRQARHGLRARADDRGRGTATTATSSRVHVDEPGATSASSSTAARSPPRSRGHVLGIDPFDEPNVAESKANTNRRARRAPAARRGERRARRRLLGPARRTGAPRRLRLLQAYLPFGEDDALEALRRTVRDRPRRHGRDRRLRAALPALDRPAAQGWPEHRRRRADRARHRRTRGAHPRQALRLRHAHRRPGDRRPPRASWPTAVGCCASRSTTWARSPESSSP